MRGTVERPDGLLFRPDLLDDDEERSLLVTLDAMELHEVRMRGQMARRTVRHFGFDYGYDTWRLTATEPLPHSLEWLRDRCAAFVELAPEWLAQTLVARYPPGATIGWHRDAPIFGPTVVGVSLLSACVMRFQRRVDDERRVYELGLPPRSAYVLGGAARAAWRHSIPPVPELRYSITFRTLRNPERWSAGEGG